jgi:hypothetical protein
MTQLREHLLKARSSHLAARYPGDLSMDVAQRPPSTRSLMWQIAAGIAAVAALIVLVVWLGSGRVEVAPIAENDQSLAQAAPQYALMSFDALAVPQPPADVSLGDIEPPSMTFSAPDFPSLSQIENEMNFTSTTKEST